MRTVIQSSICGLFMLLAATGTALAGAADELAALLPESLAGMARLAVRSAPGGAY